LTFGDSHKTQKRKNYALFVVLIVVMALIYAIAIMRMSD